MLIITRTGNSVNDIDWTKASACYQQWKVGEIKKEYAELRDFLKHNPRYMYPGQSNNKCFGKPREMPFEYIHGTAGTWGYDIRINTKTRFRQGAMKQRHGIIVMKNNLAVIFVMIFGTILLFLTQKHGKIEWNGCVKLMELR